MVERDPGKVASMLDALQTSAGDTLEDLRDLARGIYPPLLADKGLAAALEAQARRSPIAGRRVSPTVSAATRRDVESAVYFSVRGAQQRREVRRASSATVRLSAR